MSRACKLIEKTAITQTCFDGNIPTPGAIIRLGPMPAPDPSAAFLESRVGRLRLLGPKRIVFPEGNDARVRAAAQRLADDGLVTPILLAGPLHNAATARYARLYFERPKSKDITEQEALETAARP